VPGLGPVKAARYGPALLDLVAGAGADDLGSGAERPVPEGYAAWM